MLHKDLLLLRMSPVQSPAATSHKMANSALKTMRFMSTDATVNGQCEGKLIDLSALAEVPILPWQYVDDKGPAGEWGGEVFLWSWREYLARLDPDGP